MMQRFNVTFSAVSRPFPEWTPEELGSALLGLIEATSNRSDASDCPKASPEAQSIAQATSRITCAPPDVRRHASWERWVLLLTDSSVKLNSPRTGQQREALSPQHLVTGVCSSTGWWLAICSMRSGSWPFAE